MIKNNFFDDLIKLANELDAIGASKLADEINNIIKQTKTEIDGLVKTAYIRKRNGKYCVISKKGKSLGCYKTRKAALKRLRQIEFYKHNK